MTSITYWDCPRCVEGRLEHGKDCHFYPYCPNQEFLNVNGEVFLANEGKEKKATSIGIAEIAESKHEEE